MTYPTEFSKMRRILINNSSELRRVIELNNFRADCFATVYQSRREVKDTIIDKLFYDFDTDTHGTIQDNPECYNNIIQAHEILTKNNIVHRVHFSGRGFHCFVYTKPYSNKNINIDENSEYIMYLIEHYNNKELAISAYCDEVKKRMLVTCHNHFNSRGIDLDEKVGKDLARMFRIPNTWNIDGQRYCIPLDEKMLYSGYDNIRELAKSPQKTFTIFGSELFDITSVDFVEPTYEKVKINITDIDNINGRFLLPCAQHVMNTEHPGHYQKVAFIAELKKVYTLGQDCDRQELITKIENFVWSNCKWIDLNSTVITRQQIEAVVDKIDYGYSCKSKKDLGICVENCLIDNIVS